MLKKIFFSIVFLVCVNADILDNLAVKVVGKACDKGVLSSCVELANYYVDQKEYKKADFYYSKACKGHDMLGCAMRANMYILDDKSVQNYSKAYELALYACEADSAAGCQVLGDIYQFGLGVKIDLNEAFGLYTKACKANDADACYYLGTMFDKDDDGKAYFKLDYSKAFEYYKKSCDQNHPYACNALGVLYDEGNGVGKNEEKALWYFRASCKLNSEIGCFNLGNFELDNDHLQEAKKAYKKSCDLGLKEGCEELEKLNKS